jgi:polar amino acid transport system substrate-binding protein
MSLKHIRFVRTRALGRALPALLLTWMLGACGAADRTGEAGAETRASTLESIRAAGAVRVGYANEAPYAYRDSATGRLTGEAPEIVRVILAGLGVDEIEGVLTEFGSLIPGLQAGRFDIIAAGMYILPERCEQIAFSNPTYAIGEAIVVKAGNPKRLHSYEDILNDETATLGVVSGAVQRDYARTVGIPEDRVIVFPDAPSAVAGVEAGRVDAYGGTSLTVQDLLDKTRSGGLERADPFTGPAIDGVEVRGYGAFGFRKADSDLREAINEGLAGFIGSPEHLELVRPFGFTEIDMPGDVTADELCARR